MTPRRNFAAGAILMVAVLFACDPASSASVPYAGSCRFSLNGDMPSVVPLVLHPGSSNILFPSSSDVVHVDLRKPIRIVCPGKDNHFYEEKIRSLQEINAQCVTDNVFNPGNGRLYKISDLGCKKRVDAVALANGNCLNKQFTSIKVGFELPGGDFAKTMDLCFNPKSLDPVYSSFTMKPAIIGRQHNISRPLFSPSTFYKNVDISGLYRRDTQRQTLSKILGSEKLGAKYIRNDQNYYLARGHLSAKADFTYATEQHSTFFYMNTAPQWQIFNAGNWERLESSVRGFVSKRSSEVVVVTGIWGKCTLPDVNGKQQPLHLQVVGKNGTGVVVPGYYWKIVYDPAKKEGAAFVGINNPYLTTVTKQDIFCKDVCSNFKWLQWDPKNLKLGYSFCCSLDDFRKTVTTAPDFKANKLIS